MTTLSLRGYKDQIQFADDTPSWKHFIDITI